MRVVANVLGCVHRGQPIFGIFVDASDLPSLKPPSFPPPFVLPQELLEFTMSQQAGDADDGGLEPVEEYAVELIEQ